MNNEKLGISWEGFDANKAEHLGDVNFSPNAKIIFPNNTKKVTILCEDNNGQVTKTILETHNDGTGFNILVNNQNKKENGVYTIEDIKSTIKAIDDLEELITKFLKTKSERLNYRHYCFKDLAFDFEKGDFSLLCPTHGSNKPNLCDEYRGSIKEFIEWVDKNIKEV